MAIVRLNKSHRLYRKSFTEYNMVQRWSHAPSTPTGHSSVHAMGHHTGRFGNNRFW